MLVPPAHLLYPRPRNTTKKAVSHRKKQPCHQLQVQIKSNYLFTTSFNALPALNFGALDALILMVLPV
jgi:hypothetical protein